jgi:hypothetical protein
MTVSWKMALFDAADRLIDDFHFLIFYYAI